MRKSETDDYTRTKSSDKRRSPSGSTVVPLHFTVHKTGCHFESCCGICNLFPGVLLIAFCQVLIGSILLTLILTHSKMYDEMHQTLSNQAISMATGAILTGVIGAGILLMIVALTESCRAMLVRLFDIFVAGMLRLSNFHTELSPLPSLFSHLDLKRKPMASLNPFHSPEMVYLLVAAMVWVSILSLAVTKIGRACVRFNDAPKIKDEKHRTANMACVTGLFTFLGAVVYLFSFIVVFSFYHFRYVRRAILLHEAECG